MSRLLNGTLHLLNRLIPKDKNRAVFCSFPDVSDNAYAVYRYMVEHPNERTPKIRVWLVNDPAKAEEKVEKAVKKVSFSGIWQYLRAGYVFHTHGTFANRAVKGQTNVSLWHGMPLKNIMNLDATHEGWTKFEFSYTIATSPLFQEVMSRAFDCDKAACLTAGQPRNDWLFDPPPLSELVKEPLPVHDRMILWMPTYRKSTVGDVRVDGDGDAAGIGGFTPEDMKVLNAFLMAERTLLIIKVHPMQDLTLFKGLDHSHIRILTQTDAPLYQLVGRADALMTDYSSVYIDYLLLDRPIGFVLEDFDAYNHSRGFVFEDPTAKMPGDKITDKAGVYRFIKDLAEGKDECADKRRALTKEFHTYTDNGSSARLLAKLGL